MKLRDESQVPFRGFPRTCNDLEFYGSGVAVFNGRPIKNLPKTLDDIHRNLDTRLASGSKCAKAVQQYLCYYYYPLCDLDTNEIIPVCYSTCDNLVNNDECSELLMLASKSLDINSRPNNCSRAHRPFNKPPAVSNNCTMIGRLIIC